MNFSLLLDLFLIFAKISCFTFGGGYAMIPLFKAELVDAHHFLTPDQFADLLSIAQITPGPVGLNAATYAGWHQAGLPGALVATAGILVPNIILAGAAAAAIAAFKNSNLLKSILNGVRPAVAALIAAACLFFAGTSVFTAPINAIWTRNQHFSVSIPALFIFVIAVIIDRKYKPNIILILLGGGAVSWCIFFFLRLF